MGPLRTPAERSVAISSPSCACSAADDEAAAERLLTALRWPSAPQCPFCRSCGVYALGGTGSGRSRLKCSVCRRQFTVTKSTVLEGTHLPLRLWLRIAEALTAQPAPLSVAVLERDLGLGRTAARNVLARLVYASQRPPLAGLLARGGDLHRPSFHGLTPHDLLAALLATAAPTDAPRDELVV